jgi:hypothetical protein
MHTIVGPVTVTPNGGFGFDLWTPERGLGPRFSYPRVEHAHYARKFEINSRIRNLTPVTACSTIDQFASAVAAQQMVPAMGAHDYSEC